MALRVSPVPPFALTLFSSGGVCTAVPIPLYWKEPVHRGQQCHDSHQNGARECRVLLTGHQLTRYGVVQEPGHAMPWYYVLP